jgi:hypothetical protein
MQPGQHREHIEDRPAAVVFDYRHEGASDIERAEVVRFHLQPHILQRPGQQRRARRDTGVIHQNGYVGGGLGGAVNRVQIGDVELDGHDVRQVDRLGPESEALSRARRYKARLYPHKNAAATAPPSLDERSMP